VGVGVGGGSALAHVLKAVVFALSSFACMLYNYF
jgi:hypothetical protein